MNQLTVKKSQRNHSFHLVKTVKNQKTIAHNMIIWPLIGHAHLIRLNNLNSRSQYHITLKKTCEVFSWRNRKEHYLLQLECEVT